MKKKKLLLATNHSYMFYRFRKELVEKLQEKYEIILATPLNGHEEDFKKLGVKVIEIELSRRTINPFKDLKLILAYKKLIEDIKPDLVITYSIKPNVYLSQICISKKIPYFCHVQGLGSAFQKRVISQLACFLYKKGMKDARGVFFENEVSLDFFVQSDLITAKQAILLPGAGVSMKDYQYSEPINNDCFHFLYLGRFMKEKGVDELLKALEELHSEGYNFIFDFAGFCEDEYQERLEETCRQGWGVDHGFVENPVPLYEQTDAVVLPSWHEGMSNVLLEGACIGRPLITTNIPGCREAVIDKKTGFIVEKQNYLSLKSKMEKLMNLSFEQRKEMGRLGHQKMEQEFSRCAVVDKTVSEIEDRMELSK